MTTRDLYSVVTAATMLALAVTGEAAGAPQWQTITGPDGSFTVEMPGAAADQPVVQKSAQGTSYTLHQYLLPQGESILYLAQTAVFPPEMVQSGSKARLEIMLNSYAQRLERGKWTTIDWVKYDGLDAAASFGTIAASGTAGQQDQRSFVVMKGTQLFDLEYFGPLGTGKSADVDRFIASFKIGNGAPQRVEPSRGSTPLDRDRP